MKTTTKVCPNCNSTSLALFTSMNMKLCTVCHTELPWYLEKGQKPIYGSSLDTDITIKEELGDNNQT